MSVFAFLVVTLVLSQLPKLRRLRREHLRTHGKLTDDEFLLRAGIPEATRQTGLRVREAVARTMGVPPGTLHPSDSIAYALQFGFDGNDFVEIVMEIEDTLGVTITDKFWDPLVSGSDGPEWQENVCLADLARFVAQNEASLPRPCNKPKPHDQVADGS